MDNQWRAGGGELLPAEKRGRFYNEIVRKAKTRPCWNTRGDMFRVHIYPIEANGTKRITLKYTELLKMDNGLVDYHYTLKHRKVFQQALAECQV